MKNLKKIAEILIVTGVILIVGAVGDCEANNTSILDMTRKILAGGMFISTGKAGLEISKLKFARKKAKVIKLYEKDGKTGEICYDYKRAV